MDTVKNKYLVHCTATVVFTAEIVAESFEEAARIADLNADSYIKNDSNMQAYYVDVSDISDEL